MLSISDIEKTGRDYGIKQLSYIRRFLSFQFKGNVNLSEKLKGQNFLLSLIGIDGYFDISNNGIYLVLKVVQKL